MGAYIRKNRKIEKATEFVERIKKVQEKVGVALSKTQKEMKRQADKERKEVKKQKKENKIMLSIKDLVFKKRLARKLVN